MSVRAGVIEMMRVGTDLDLGGGLRVGEEDATISSNLAEPYSGRDRVDAPCS